jgi:long-chain acyl-CoA synthetase
MWEKFQDLVWSHARCVLDEPELQRLAEAVRLGHQLVTAAQAGRPIQPAMRQRWDELTTTVVARVRHSLGLGKCVTAIGGSAPVPPDVALFACAFGIPLLEGYGLTETSCVITMNQPGDYRIGTVGKPVPGVEVRVGEGGEIQTRSPLNTTGYLGLAEATEALFTPDGWLRTGDLGEIDADGFVSITGRAKELIITAYGKNIAPVPIESLLKKHPLITQALVVGEGRPFLSALLVLDPGAARRFIAAGESGGGGVALERNPVVLEAVQTVVDTVNKELSQPEKIKRFHVLTDEWTAATGELTPSMKLRRNIIQDRYQAVIDKLYA